MVAPDEEEPRQSKALFSPKAVPPPLPLSQPPWKAVRQASTRLRRRCKASCNGLGGDAHVYIVSLCTSLARSRPQRMYRLAESSSSIESGVPPF